MPNDVTLEIYYDGSWHDLVASDDVLVSQSITIQRGDGAESAALRPASISARFDNSDDRFRITNPESPLYGLTGRNTPMRVKVDSIVRGYTQIVSWSNGETDDFDAAANRGNAWVDVDSGGVLEQIAQWSEPLRSAYTRMVLAQTDLIGYWPLEEDSGATSLSNLVEGGPPGVFTGTVTLGADSFPLGCEAALQVGSDGTLTGTFVTAYGSGWFLSFAIRVTATLTASYQEIFRWADSVGRVWAWECNNTDYAWRIYDTDGSTIDYQAAANNLTTANQWVRLRMIVSISGSTLTYEPEWFAQGASVATGVTKTFTATTTGQPKSWSRPATTYSTDAYYSQIYATTQTAVDWPTALAAFDGHSGESAFDRFSRLMSEFGLDWSWVGDETLSVAMGPQRAAIASDLLRETNETEDGLMFDDAGANRVIFMLRNARYNQTAVSISVTEMTRRPRETNDLLGVRNKITVSHPVTAEEARAVDETGPLGTGTPPNGVGPIEGKVSANVFDSSTLPAWANWWLRRGTVNLPRYPEVTVNLAALGDARRDAIAAIDVGNVIEISDFRENTIRLQVLGYTEVVEWPVNRLITFVCAPDQQFVVGEYDAATSRYDLRTSTLNEDLGTGDTWAHIVTTDPTESWSVQGAPYNVTISGQANLVIGASRRGVVQYADSSYETGNPDGWTVNGGTSTLTGDNSTAPYGTYVALITVAGSPGSVQFFDQYGSPGVPAATYKAIGWFRCSVSRTIDVELVYYDSGFGSLGTSVNAYAITANTWTEISVTGTAPASTAYIYQRVSMNSSPANGTLLRVKGFDLIRTDTDNGAQVLSLTRGTNGVTKTLSNGDEIHITTPGRWAI